jgi:hypothetical protein
MAARRRSAEDEIKALVDNTEIIDGVLGPVVQEDMENCYRIMSEMNENTMIKRDVGIGVGVIGRGFKGIDVVGKCLSSS